MSPDARALLDAARGADEPTAEDRDRLRGAIVTSLAGGAALASSAVAGSTAAAATSGVAGTAIAGTAITGTAIAGTATVGTGTIAGLSMFALTAKVVAAVAVVSVAGAVVLSSAPESASESAVVATTLDEAPTVGPAVITPRRALPSVESVEVEVAVILAPPVDVSAEIQAAVEPAIVPTPRRRRIALRSAAPAPTADEPAVQASASEAPASSADSLGAELRLLRAAQRARSTGETARAISLLHQHRQSFPAGALALERDATLALCACDAGQGSTAAAGFLAAHPGSPLAARVRAACAD